MSDDSVHNSESDRGPRDSRVDASLSRVVVPEGLGKRVLHAVLTDASLDAILRDIALPEGLLGRLADGVLDEALRETPAQPPTCAPAARRAAWESWRRERRARQWTTATTWLIAASLLYALGMASLFGRLRPAPTAAEFALIDLGPLQVEGAWGADDALVRMAPWTVSEPARSPELLVPLGLAAAPSLVEETRAELEEVDLGQEQLVARYEYLGYPPEAPPRRPWFDVPPEPTPRPLPTSAGYDRLFHGRHGVSPWVATNTPELAQSELPLVVDGGGFDRLLQMIRDGRRPSPSEVRPEDWLAAMPYQFPLPQGTLGLRTAAGPFPWGEGKGLLLVGVQAGDHRDAERPLDLTIALDVSERMGGERLAWVARVLGEQLRLLGRDDRVSVLALGDSPRWMIEGAGVDQVAALCDVLRQLQGQGTADWVRGLPHAVAAALDGAGQPAPESARRALVVIGAGEPQLQANSGDSSAPTEQQLAELLRSARGTGVATRWIVVRDEPSDRLRDWLRLGETELTEARTADTLCDGLRAACGWRTGPLADQVRLSIRWSPGQVEAYRLLGHDAWIMAEDGTLPSVSLRPGQQVVVLLEVAWEFEGRVGGSGGSPGHSAVPGEAGGMAPGQVAELELRWKESGGGAERLARQRVSRLQFAESFEQSPRDLRLAALAAQGAALASESVHVQRSTWSDWSELADRVVETTNLRSEVRWMREVAEAFSQTNR